MRDILSDSDLRLEKARHRVGSACVVCGEAHPHCIEQHHIAGIRHSDETVPVCRNCHRKLSDSQRDHPDPVGDTIDPVEVIAHAVLGFADLLQLVVEQLKHLGHTLIEHAREAVSDVEVVQ